MKYKAVVFDLDGTLTNTLTDLMNSTNHALSQMGWPVRSRTEIRQMVGNGVRKLIERAVPEGVEAEQEALCFDHFKAHYLIHCQDHTAIYPGVAELLRELHAEGVRMAIVSNKLQAGVDELYQRFFQDTVAVAVGERPGLARKPEPDMVHLALQALGVSPQEAVYVGDSDVDLQTASRSGLPCISVLWGFRDRPFLEAHGATCLVEKPSQIPPLLKSGL